MTETKLITTGIVVLIDEASLKSCRDLFGETVGIFGAKDYPGWRVDEPPKDGRAIIAKGRIISEDEMGCSVSPYLGEIRWKTDERNPAGGIWVYGGSCHLSVTCSPDETFVIDWWIKPPRGESVKY